MYAAISSAALHNKKDDPFTSVRFGETGYDRHQEWPPTLKVGQ